MAGFTPFTNNYRDQSTGDGHVRRPYLRRADVTPLVESHLPAAQASSQLRSGAVPAAGGRAEGLEEARLCTGANPKSPNEISQAPRRTQVLEQSDGFVVSSVSDAR